MMRSMFSGVSGLKTHQTKMDVIGNNIANVNTVGFKSGRVTFQEVFNQTLKGAGAADPANGRSGSNPMQIGLGVGVAAIDTNMTRGSSQRTDNPTDLSIEGDGFFIIKPSNADTFKFTRAGNFGIDSEGYLNLNGNSVCGWDFEPSKDDPSKMILDTIKEPKPLNFYKTVNGTDKLQIGAERTSNATLIGNLDARLTTPDPAVIPPVLTSTNSVNVPMTVYDDLGNEVKLNVKFYKATTAAGQIDWNMKVTDSAGNDIQVNKVGTTTKDDVITLKDSKVIPDDLKKTITIPANAATSAKEVKIDIDIGGLTMFANDSSVKPSEVNGNPPGNLVTYNIGPDGIITGIYSNGKQKSIGCVGVSTFSNPGGLLKVGENMFMPSPNSGNFRFGKPGTGSAGPLNPGTLEMSNVDLSKEFTDMIVTQRGFQANSRIITASDEMLQELVNIKR